MCIAARIVNIECTLLLFCLLFHIYRIMLLNSNFPPACHFFKHHSACMYPFSTNSIQLFVTRPFPMSIATYFVNIVCIVLIVCLQLSLCSSSGYYTIGHPSLSFGMIWSEHIKSHMCWLCLVQISIPSLPNVFKSSVWDDIQYMPNASSLGKSNMCTCPAFITIAQHEKNNGPEADISMSGDPQATSTPQVPNHTSR